MFGLVRGKLEIIIVLFIFGYLRLDKLIFSGYRLKFVKSF